MIFYFINNYGNIDFFLEIDRRLGELNRGVVSPTLPSYNLLQELKDQEAKNQRTLGELRRQLTDMQLITR